MIRYARVGMDVEVRGQPGRWMIVALDGDHHVRLVSIDAPGDVLHVRNSECREQWPAEAA